MYKLKVLVSLEIDSDMSVGGDSYRSLASYESLESDNLVEVLEVACDVDDFFLRNCIFATDECLEKHHRRFFLYLFAQKQF